MPVGLGSARLTDIFPEPAGMGKQSGSPRIKRRKWACSRFFENQGAIRPDFSRIGASAVGYNWGRGTNGSNGKWFRSRTSSLTCFTQYIPLLGHKSCRQREVDIRKVNIETLFLLEVQRNRVLSAYPTHRERVLVINVFFIGA